MPTVKSELVEMAIRGGVVHSQVIEDKENVSPEICHSSKLILFIRSRSGSGSTLMFISLFEV